MHTLPGAAVAVFPDGPERGIYNNALMAREAAAADRATAIEGMEAAYADSGVEEFAVWVHESDRAMRRDLGRRGYSIDSSTMAMGMWLDDVTVPRPTVEASPRWRGRTTYGSSTSRPASSTPSTARRST